MAKIAVKKDSEHVSITPKRNATDWATLLNEVKTDHWRNLNVTIQLREWLLAGKPAKLDAANAMIKARGLEDVLEARRALITEPADRAELAEEVQDEGLCEFHRREGMPGLWMPANNVKAGLKENWSVLGYRVAHRGSRGALAEGVFVTAGVEGSAEADWIFVGASEQPAIYTAVAHTTGPRGPVSSIKRHEYVVRPRLWFTIHVARAIAGKLPDEAIARTLYHFGEHGLGACRSQGFGRFDVQSVEESV